MAQKFFGTFFGRRKTSALTQKNDLKKFEPLNPAQDIAEFEYPPESSFYENTGNTGLKD